MSISPEKPLLGDKSTATILGPDGKVANYPTLFLTTEEAKLLREYKKFLLARGYREALYCNLCWNQSLSDGTEAFVNDSGIGIKCRCRLMLYKGPTY